MSEERTSIEWWEKQWNQLKTELDKVNPQYDAAQLRIKELENQVATQQIAVEASTKKADELVNKLSEVTDKYEELSNKYLELSNTHNTLVENHDTVSKDHKEAQKEAAGERVKRRNVLSKVLEAAKKFVDECNAGLVGD